MIKCNDGKIQIDGDIIDINEEIGNIIMHSFRFAEEFPSEIEDIAKKLYGRTILQTLIISRCNLNSEELYKKMSNENTFKQFQEMVNEIEKSLNIVRSFLNDLEDHK